MPSRLRLRRLALAELFLRRAEEILIDPSLGAPSVGDIEVSGEVADLRESLRVESASAVATLIVSTVTIGQTEAAVPIPVS